MTVYAFLYCGCVFESAFATMSLHTTKKGAYKAMNKYLNDEYNKMYNKRNMSGKFVSRYSTFKVGVHCAWKVEPIEVIEDIDTSTPELLP